MTSEDLHRAWSISAKSRVVPVSKSHLNDDHCKREKIAFIRRFHATVQANRGNWLSPPPTATNSHQRAGWKRVGQAKSCNPWATRVIYDDVWLSGCQNDCNTGFSSNRALRLGHRESHYGNGGNQGRWRHQLTWNSVSTTQDIGTDRTPTRSSRFVSGWWMIYLLGPTPVIQAKTTWVGSLVIPRKGTIFGCTKCFHLTTSLKKSCRSSQYGRYER